MTNERIDLVERLLRKRAIDPVMSDEERAIAAVLGEHYLTRLDDRGWLDVALSDLQCIREM